MKIYLIKKLLAFWLFLKQLIFLIGLIASLLFVKLQYSGNVTINPDIFRSSEEIEQINRNLKDFEAMQIQDLPEKIKGAK